jgi:hypothetical protein
MSIETAGFIAMVKSKSVVLQDKQFCDFPGKQREAEWG